MSIVYWRFVCITDNLTSNGIQPVISQKVEIMLLKIN
jgi:hypothetical protein